MNSNSPVSCSSYHTKTISSSSSNNSSGTNILTKPTPELTRPPVKDPQEYFRKSCSMKIAAEEAVEAGDEAEEEEEVEMNKVNLPKRAKGD